MRRGSMQSNFEVKTFEIKAIKKIQEKGQKVLPKKFNDIVQDQECQLEDDEATKQDLIKLADLYLQAIDYYQEQANGETKLKIYKKKMLSILKDDRWADQITNDEKLKYDVIKKENEFKKKSELDTLIFNSMEERFKMDKSKKDDLKLQNEAIDERILMRKEKVAPQLRRHQSVDLQLQKFNQRSTIHQIIKQHNDEKQLMKQKSEQIEHTVVQSRISMPKIKAGPVRLSQDKIQENLNKYSAEKIQKYLQNQSKEDTFTKDNINTKMEDDENILDQTNNKTEITVQQRTCVCLIQ